MAGLYRAAQGSVATQILATWYRLLGQRGLYALQTPRQASSLRNCRDHTVWTHIKGVAVILLHNRFDYSLNAILNSYISENSVDCKAKQIIPVIWLKNVKCVSFFNTFMIDMRYCLTESCYRQTRAPSNINYAIGKQCPFMRSNMFLNKRTNINFILVYIYIYIYIYKVKYFTSFYLFTQNLPMAVFYPVDGSLALQKIAICMVTAIRISNLIYIANYGGNVWNKTSKRLLSTADRIRR